jgi:hypothetical protein
VRGFAEELIRFQAKALANAKRVKTRALKRVVGKEGIIGDTPVDTSRLKSNWQTTTGSPASSSKILMDDGQTALSELGSTLESADLEETIYETNNLDYGPKIEFEGGSPRKAPKGMVRINLMKAPRIFKEEAAKELR